MASYTINFDDSLGCANCPFCKDHRYDNINFEYGFFCSKETPNKLITDNYKFSNKDIPKPSWCSLEKTKDVLPEIPIKMEFSQSRYIPKTEHLIAQETFSPYIFKEAKKEIIKDHIKKRLMGALIHNLAFLKNIKFKEIQDYMGNIVIRGELDIVKLEENS